MRLQTKTLYVLGALTIRCRSCIAGLLVMVHVVLQAHQ